MWIGKQDSIGAWGVLYVSLYVYMYIRIYVRVCVGIDMVNQGLLLCKSTSAPFPLGTADGSWRFAQIPIRKLLNRRGPYMRYSP